MHDEALEGTSGCLSCAPTVCPAPSARAPVTALAEALRTHVRFGAPAPAPGTWRAVPRPRPLSTVTTAAAGFALLVRWLCTKEGLGVRATPAAAPTVPAAVGCSPAWVATAAFPPAAAAAAAAGEDARDSVTTRSLAGRQQIHQSSQRRMRACTFEWQDAPHTAAKSETARSRRRPSPCPRHPPASPSHPPALRRWSQCGAAPAAVEGK